MTLDKTAHADLVARLSALLASSGVDRATNERLLHDLQVHEIELELQNRELREAQNALEESRNRYAELYDYAPVPYFTFDPQGCVVECNLTGAALIGRDRAQLVGAPFSALVTLADPARFWSHLRRCADASAPTVTDLELVVRGVTLRLRAVTSPGAGGDRGSFRTAFIDIAALESERRLRQDAEQLDTAKTAITRALASAKRTAQTDIHQVVVDEARLLVGAEFAALGIGQHGTFESWVYAGLSVEQAAKIGPPPRIVGALAEVIDQRRTLRLANVTQHPAFNGFPLHHPAMTSFLGVPIGFGDDVVGHLYMANSRGGAEFSADDQRKLESLARYVGVAMEIARLSDTAQTAIRTRDTLLAIVSHDLRGPLSSISMTSTLLTETVQEPAIRKRVDLIARAAGRMSRLIDDLLTASTIEAGRLGMTARPERFDELVADALEPLELAAERGEIRLETQIPADLPLIRCDRERIHQVLSNLLGNALKFTPPGGTIRIDVSLSDELRVSVADTGPGIPADALPHVFDRYWQLTKAGGVGLGLYICRGIVDNHGGRIWVESTPGEGAKFTFSLPTRPAPPTGTNAVGAASEPHGATHRGAPTR